MASRFLGPASPRTTFPAALVALLLGTTAALAQDHCQGTLCDLYYDHVAGPQQPAPTQPTAPAPPRQAQAPAGQPSDGLLGRLFGGGAPQQQQQTTSAPPAKRPLVAVQGGGVIGMMHGDAPTRCTGTLCDLFYGGPPPEEPAAQPVPTAEPAADAPAVEEAPVEGRRTPTVAEPSCVASARDPWQCYR